MYYLSLCLRAVRLIFRHILSIYNWLNLRYILFLNNVQYKSIHSNGLPYFSISHKNGCCIIGKDLTINNGLKNNPIGFQQRMIIRVEKDGNLIIGNNVGMSQGAIVCYKSIQIDDFVKLGGGVKIYDTDFHSLISKDRYDKKLDNKNKVCAAIHIKENAFIGAGTIILKGVTIGKNCIIGAGSIVTKNIPDNQIWAGNPAKYIRDC